MLFICIHLQNADAKMYYCRENGKISIFFLLLQLHSQCDLNKSSPLIFLMVLFAQRILAQSDLHSAFPLRLHLCQTVCLIVLYLTVGTPA